jgi:hypothetical protein
MESNIYDPGIFILNSCYTLTSQVYFFFLLAPVFDTRAEVGEDSLFPPVSLPDPTQHKLKQSNKFIFVHFSKIPKNLPLDIL